MKKRVLLSTIITLLIFLVCIEVKAEINVVDNNTYMVERLANLSSPKITSVTASNDLVTVKSTGNFGTLKACITV